MFKMVTAQELIDRVSEKEFEADDKFRIWYSKILKEKKLREIENIKGWGLKY